jgi:hypothetical protein
MQAEQEFTENMAVRLPSETIIAQQKSVVQDSPFPTGIAPGSMMLLSKW